MKHTDKTLLLVVGGLAALGGLCILCIVAALFFPAKLWVSGSAPEAAKKFLSENAVVKAKVGTITSFGLFPSGSVKIDNGVGAAHLTFDLTGDAGRGRAVVDLSKPSKGEWKVVGATLHAGGQAFVLEGKGAVEPTLPGQGQPPPAPEPKEDKGSLPA